MPPDAELGAARTGEGGPGDPTWGFLTLSDASWTGCHHVPCPIYDRAGRDCEHVLVIKGQGGQFHRAVSFVDDQAPPTEHICPQARESTPEARRARAPP